MRRAAQRAELASERALRDQEAEQAQLVAREAVEKSRLAQERNITEERIRNEEDTQRREIARRRSIDESRDEDARDDRARADRARTGAREGEHRARGQRRASWRSSARRRLEIAELERQIALAEKALEVTKAEAERRARRDHGQSGDRDRPHRPGPALDEVQDRARAASRGDADRQAAGIRGGRDRGGRRGRARPDRHRARHR